MSLYEHKIVGKELRDAKNKLSVVLNIISGTVTANHLDRALKAVRSIDHLVCGLDDILARDHPEQFDSTIYYPTSDQHEQF